MVADLPLGHRKLINTNCHIPRILESRMDETPSKPMDWPGAKALPGTMAFVAFLAILANVEGLMNL